MINDTKDQYHNYQLYKSLVCFWHDILRHGQSSYILREFCDISKLGKNMEMLETKKRKLNVMLKLFRNINGS